MDKRSTFGFVLIGLVLILWMWLQTPSTPVPHAGAPADTIHAADTIRRESVPVQQPAPAPEETTQTPQGQYGKYFAARVSGAEKILTVITDQYVLEISSKGGLVRTCQLNGFATWDHHPVQLIDDDKGGDLSLLFTSADGRLVDTRSLYFDLREGAWTTYRLSGTDSVSVTLVLPSGENSRLEKRFTFANGRYSFDTEFRFVNMAGVISNYEYQVVWENGLRYAEYNSVDESSFAMGYVYSGGELTEIDASKFGEVVKRDINGSTDWVAARNKYFAVALLPEKGVCQGAYIEGIRTHAANNGAKEDYSLALKMPLKSGNEKARVTVFLGPIDFDIVKSYGRNLQQILSLGMAWIVRPISEYVMIPLFHFLHLFIPNYGWVIIAFSVIIKIALTPLTRTSMKSMKRMQAITPMMNEVREKYKDDPTKQNQAIMNLYKEYGVNPASGCLPLLLQMPILFALYAVFRSSIALRQAEFILWIHDLSTPDFVVNLPFSIPFLGITAFSGLALAMGVTMFFQNKMTVTDPRQKAMVWMMPVMMTIIFNNLPSGLNLYYFVFNVLSIGQQMWFNKKGADEPLRKVEPKKNKGGFMSRMTKDLPKLK